MTHDLMRHDVIDPCNAEPIASFELATAEDVDATVATAKAALPAWKRVSTQDRARLIRRFADAVADHADELAETEARNVGKPASSPR